MKADTFCPSFQACKNIQYIDPEKNNNMHASLLLLDMTVFEFPKRPI